MVTLKPLSDDELYAYLAQELMLPSTDVDREVLLIPANMLRRWTALGLYLGEVMAGFVCFDVEQRYLASLYVNPAFRGSGIAKWVVQLLQPSWLEVMPSNVQARKLYARLGYAPGPYQPYPQRVRYLHLTHPQYQGETSHRHAPFDDDRYRQLSSGDTVAVPEPSTPAI